MEERLQEVLQKCDEGASNSPKGLSGALAAGTDRFEEALPHQPRTDAGGSKRKYSSLYNHFWLLHQVR